MNDLAERLRQIERNPSPDLWEEIASRPAPSSPGDRQGLRHRVAAGLVAAVVSIAAFAFLVIAFRSEPDGGALGEPWSPLTIRVWYGEVPHIEATYEGVQIPLDSIETAGSELDQPSTQAPMTLPTGTPIEFENLNYAETMSVFALATASGEQVADGACIVPGALRALPGPGASAFIIFVEWPWGSTGVGFEAETVGEDLAHDSALDPSSAIDANKLGLASCDGSTSDKETFAEGTDPLAGRWLLFTQRETEFGPVLGVNIPGQQTFTVELHPLNERTLGLSSMTGTGDDILLLAQIVAPSVASAEIMLDDGAVIGGDLVELPDGIIGSAKVFVAGFSSKMSVEGQRLDPNGFIIAYGEDGEELERRRLARLG